MKGAHAAGMKIPMTGLDVTIVQGNGSGNTAQLVANGRAHALRKAGP